jgi:cyclic pyranopterin phosphate synthase
MDIQGFLVNDEAYLYILAVPVPRSKTADQETDHARVDPAHRETEKPTRKPTMPELTHFDESGAARMVDVSGKAETARTARASGRVRMQPQTLTLIADRALAKGDVCEVARLAGIMAAKQTGLLIPLCHPLPLSAVTLTLTPCPPDCLRIEAEVKCVGRTGVEMEALTAVSVAALTVYDMCKAVDRGMTIECIRLEEKAGGQHGPYRRDQAQSNQLNG